MQPAARFRSLGDVKRRNLILVLVGLALLAVVWSFVRGRGGGGESADGGEASGDAEVTAGPAPRGAAPDPMKQKRASIGGTVRDDQGAPLGGALVCASGESPELADEEDREPHCATSAAAGTYLIADLPPATYRVSGSAAQRIPGAWKGADGHRSFRLAAGEQRTGIDLVLAGGGVALRGVVNDIGGGPIAEAWVGASSMRGDAWASARADADGKFTLWVQPGTVWAVGRAEGYADARKRWPAPSDKLEILLTPESVLAGRVVEVGTDKPVAGAMVEASSWDGGDGASGTARTDADGRFRITRLQPGRYKPEASADGKWGEAKASVLLGLGQTTEDVIIEVHPAFMVFGKVLIEEEGGATRPCPRGSVRLNDDREYGDRAEIAADGSVRFQTLFPGSYGVRVDCDDQLARDEYPEVVVADQDVKDVTWTVTAGGTLVVAVKRGDGTPVAGAEVRLDARGRTARRGRWNGETTDAAGEARLRGLKAGSYDLVVDSADHIDPEPKPIEVAAGEQRVDVTVTAGGAIAGVVVDVAGTPVAGATVSVRGGERWARFSWRDQVYTGDDGSFRIDGLAPGETRVIASRGFWQELRRPGAGDDDEQGEIVTVAEGKVADVKLVVESQSEKISGTVVDHTGAAITDAFVSAQRESESAGANRSWARRATRWNWDRQATAADAEGKFTIANLSPGTYTVRAYRRGGGEGTAEGVKAGTSTRLVIRPTTSLTGKVEIAGGGAPERFEVSIADDKTGFEREESFFRTGGAFTLTDLPAGVFKLSAEAPEGTASTDVALEEGEQRTGVTVTLEGRVTLTGRVVEMGTGKPVEGMRVWVSGAGGVGRPMARWDDPNMTSGADGRFKVERAPRGRLRVMVSPMSRTTSTYLGGMKMVTVPPDARDLDIGDVEMLKSRLEPSERDGDLGFELSQSGPDEDLEKAKLQVASIRARGPADGSGLVVGDVIVSVDDTDVKGNNIVRWWALSRVPPGTVLKLGLARGATVTITAGKPR